MARVEGRIVDKETGQGLPLAIAQAFIAPVSDGAPSPEGKFDLARVELSIDFEGRFAANIPDPHASGGQIWFLAAAPAHREYRLLSGPHPLNAGEPLLFKQGETVHIDARLERGTTLKGRVTDPHGCPLAGVMPNLILAGPNWCGWPWSMMMGTFRWPPKIETDADGYFQFLHDLSQGKRDGRWVLAVEHEAYAPTLVQSIEELPAVDGIITVAVAVKPGLELCGTVQTSTGQPVTAAKITATGGHLIDEPVCLRFTQHAVSDKDGAFHIAGLTKREYTLEVRANGCAPGLQSITPIEDEFSSVNFKLNPGYDLAGRVLQQDGTPATLEVLCRMEGSERRIYDRVRHASAHFQRVQVPPWSGLLGPCSYPDAGVVFER